MEQNTIARPTTDVLVNNFVRSVYNWMAVGLALTGCVAFYVSNDLDILRVIASPMIDRKSVV